MRLPWPVVAGVVVAAGLVGAYRVASWEPVEVAGNPNHRDGDTAAYGASGIVHVHTTYSDGGGSIDEVAAAAAAAGLDFVIVTDHNTFAGKVREGYIAGVLVLVGTEVSTTSGHLLGFGLPAPTFNFSGDASDALADINDLGGVAVVAHPTSPRLDFGWRDWDLPGAWGLEVLNGDTQWRSSSWIRAVWSTALYPLNPTYALLRLLTRPTATDRWDGLLEDRDVPAIAGSDSHSYIGLIEASGIPFPSYRSVFELARNHVVLEREPSGDAADDGAAVVNALAQGRSYIALDALAPADGFFFIADEGGQQWSMGDTISPNPSLRLRAGGTLPVDARVSLLKDGHLIATENGAVVWDDVSPGVYRIQVDLPDWEPPWILSNAIYVFDPQVARRRREHLRISPAPVPTRIVRQVDPLDTSTTFVAANDPSTLMREDIVDEEAGPGGQEMVRLEFTLGTPTEDHPSPFAAVTSFRSLDLSDGSGLTLSVKADGVYRLNLQLRDRNPDSAIGEGTEWWSASIKTSTTLQRVAVPFSRFRSTDPATDGQLDLDEIEGLVLVVDAGTVLPGTTGVIWFDDLSLYRSR